MTPSQNSRSTFQELTKVWAKKNWRRKQIGATKNIWAENNIGNKKLCFEEKKFAEIFFGNKKRFGLEILIIEKLF